MLDKLFIKVYYGTIYRENKMYKYAIKYNLNTESREEGYALEVDGYSLCDVLISIPIVIPSDGGYSQRLISFNGKTKKPCTQKEIFKAWMMLGMSLYEENMLNGWQKEFIELHYTTATSIIEGLEHIQNS